MAIDYREEKELNESLLGRNKEHLGRGINNLLSPHPHQWSHPEDGLAFLFGESTTNYLLAMK